MHFLYRQFFSLDLAFYLLYPFGAESAGACRPSILPGPCDAAAGQGQSVVFFRSEFPDFFFTLNAALGGTFRTLCRQEDVLNKAHIHIAVAVQGFGGSTQTAVHQGAGHFQNQCRGFTSWLVPQFGHHGFCLLAQITQITGNQLITGGFPADGCR